MTQDLQTQQQTSSDLYAAPQAELAPQASTAMTPGQGPALASRGVRLGAFLLDIAIGMGAFFTMYFLIGLFGELLGSAAMAVGVVPMVALLGINLYLLAVNGQTVGKKALGIKIVRGDLRTPASIWRILFMRYLPVNLVSNIPCIGFFLYLINFLFIFRHDKKCVHDHIADTHVVEDVPVVGTNQPTYGEPAPVQDFKDPLDAPTDDGRWDIPADAGQASGGDDLDSSWGDDFDDPWGDDDSSGPKW